MFNSDMNKHKREQHLFLHVNCRLHHYCLKSLLCRTTLKKQGCTQSCLLESCAASLTRGGTVEACPAHVLVNLIWAEAAVDIGVLQGRVDPISTHPNSWQFTWLLATVLESLSCTASSTSRLMASASSSFSRNDATCSSNGSDSDFDWFPQQSYQACHDFSLNLCWNCAGSNNVSEWVRRQKWLPSTEAKSLLSKLMIDIQCTRCMKGTSDQPSRHLHVFAYVHAELFSAILQS